jgi:glycosyltransferase involved in cell wall biosynthesis
LGKENILKSSDELHPVSAPVPESPMVEAHRAADAVAAQRAVEIACASAAAAAAREAEAAGRQAAAAEARATEGATRANEQADRAIEQTVMAQAAIAEMQILHARVSQAEARLSEAEARLVAIHRSTSWRVTAPLRAMKQVVQRCRGVYPDRATLEMGTPDARLSRPTVFVECTHTYYSDVNSGIQRVVRNVLRNAAAAAALYGYSVVPVKLDDGRLIGADLNTVLQDKQRVQAPRLSVAASRASEEVSVNLDLRTTCTSDILLLLDSSWYSPIWPAVEHFKQRGGRVVCVVYDLIPITHSHTCVPEGVALFKWWLRRAAGNIDTFVCISQSTTRQLKDYLSSGEDAARWSGDVPIPHFYLGSELDFAMGTIDIRLSIRNMFGTSRFAFLMVGSIEPRKNHDFTLDAFERFWSDGGRASLIIIGRHGWKTEAFLDRVACHPECGRRLYIVRDASDTELDYAYKSASALIIASEIEGFGLPVVEALQRGLPVICSDIPVFREIGRGNVTFFGLQDPGQLTAAVAAFCDSHDVSGRDERTPQPWLTWRESTDQLFAAIFHSR